MANVLRTPLLTRTRIVLAIAIAVFVDGLQLLFSGPGWFGPDQVLDVFAMLALTPIIGFHPLLLPTFVLKVLPVIESIPTWTGCVLVVVFLRRKAQSIPPAPPPVAPCGEPPPVRPQDKVIDI